MTKAIIFCILLVLSSCTYEMPMNCWHEFTCCDADGKGCVTSGKLIKNYWVYRDDDWRGSMLGKAK